MQELSQNTKTTKLIVGIKQKEYSSSSTMYILPSINVS